MKINKVDLSTVENKKYYGIATVNPIIVNPTKDQLSKLFEGSNPKEPNYKVETTDGNKKFRLDIYFKTIPEYNNNIEKIFKASFFIGNKPRTNKDNTKYQYINDYGATCWIPENDFSQCPSFFEKDGAKIAFEGEEDLTNFIKALYNIPNHTFTKANGEVSINPKEDCVCRIEDWIALVNGNIKEIEEIIKTGKDQPVKILIGIKDDSYETVYVHKISKIYNKADDAFKREIDNRAKFDASINNMKYSFEPLKPFSIDSTKPETIYNNAEKASVEQDEDLPF